MMLGGIISRLAGETEPATPTAQTPTPTMWDLLSNDRRRHALSYIASREQAATRDVAEYVTAVETGTPVAELTYDDVESAYISLRQQHLPALADHALVIYDADENTVQPTGDGAVASELIDTFDGRTGGRR